LAPVKVLLASEDPRARAWVIGALGPGWEVAEASTGIEARRIVEKEPPDLLISDETMEGYGAFGLTRDVKALPNPPAVVILLERAQDDWLAKWSGADRWLVRPIDPFELAAAARSLADRHAHRAAGTVGWSVGEEGNG
jgi:DNA-binding response OmpR family regulator